MRAYAGIPQENATLENSEVMPLTVPYDGTSTWGKGGLQRSRIVFERF